MRIQGHSGETMSKKFRKPSVKMHFGAAHNEIVINGVTLHRGGMKRHEVQQASNMLCNALKRCGFFKRKKAVQAVAA
jgi:hypothetical protein